jgi:hypothetical protein
MPIYRINFYYFEEKTVYEHAKRSGFRANWLNQVFATISQQHRNKRLALTDITNLVNPIGQVANSIAFSASIICCEHIPMS